MANFKKGIALALVATTAFTFAPVSTLGLNTAVVAQAANNKLIGHGDINASVGSQFDLTASVDYTLSTAQQADVKFFKVSTSNVNVINFGTSGVQANGTTATAATDTESYYRDGATVELHAAAVASATPANIGDAVITYEYVAANGVKQTGSFTVHVSKASDNAIAQIKGAAGAINYTAGSAITIDKRDVKVDSHAYTLSLDDAADGTTFNAITNTVSSNPGVVEVDQTTPATPTVKFLKKGTAVITITSSVNTPGATSKKTANQTEVTKITFNVIPTASTMKIGDKEVVGGDLAATTPIIKTINLTADNASATIGATLEDAQSSSEKLHYVGVYKRTNSNTTVDTTLADYNSTDLVVKDDKVTATANALNATEQYYDILVTNNLESANDATEKNAIIRVIAIRNTKAFTSVNVNLEGKDYKAEAEYDETGATKDKVGSDATTATLTLSTVDKTSVPVTVTSNVAAANLKVESSDPSVVAYENGTLVAKKIGVAQVTATASSDTQHYGNVKVIISVNVTDQLVNNTIAASDVNLTRTVKTGNPNAKAKSDKTTLSYRFVKENAKGEWESASDSNLTLDAKTGEITYVTTASGSAILEISGNATNDSLAPKPVYVKVTYNNDKNPSKLTVVTKSVNVEEGQTATIAATGTVLTYVSSDSNVATVAADGTVTAVKPGVAVVTVMDAGDENTEGGSVDVPVYVTAKAAPVVIAKPAKVTGLKVANVKGAKVKVSFKKSAKATGYLVTYKVGKKTVKKTTTKTALTLSVKKGAKVKVSVKAFNKNAAGAKQYSAAVSKTLKTDKK